MDNDNALKSIKNNQKSSKSSVKKSSMPDFLSEEAPKNEQKEDEIREEIREEYHEDLQEETPITPVDSKNPSDDDSASSVESTPSSDLPEEIHEEIEKDEKIESESSGDFGKARILTMNTEPDPVLSRVPDFNPETPRPSTEPKKKHGLVIFLIIIFVLFFGTCAASYYIIIFRPDLNPFAKPKTETPSAVIDSDASSASKSIEKLAEESPRSLLAGFSDSVVLDSTDYSNFLLSKVVSNSLIKFLSNSLTNAEKTSLALNSELAEKSLEKISAESCSADASCLAVKISYDAASSLTSEMFGLTTPPKEDLKYIGGKYSFHYDSTDNTYYGYKASSAAPTSDYLVHTNTPVIEDNAASVEVFIKDYLPETENTAPTQEDYKSITSDKSARKYRFDFEKTNNALILTNIETLN